MTPPLPTRDLAIPLPPALRAALETLRDHGCRGLLVGGAIRDHFFGIESKDLDIEVYGADYDQLVTLLAPFDSRNKPGIVGKSFGVLKIRDSDGNEYDVSVPRRESKTAAGHRGFHIELDDTITPREAAARRDYTINAIAWNPLTLELHDDFGGVQDIGKRILRATSPAFVEDPLRVLRGMQFAARFDLSLEADTAAMARELIKEYHTLALERIAGEWMKLFTKGVMPGRGLEFLIQCGWIALYPELAALTGGGVDDELVETIDDPAFPALRGDTEVRQEPSWHPEGGVVRHTIHVMNAAAQIARRENITGDDKAVLIMAALSHDLGKAACTRFDMRKGKQRIVSPGHEAAGIPLTESLLRRIGIRNDLIRRVLPLVGYHMQTVVYEPASRTGNVRQLAEQLHPATLHELGLVIASDMGGRPPLSGGLPERAQQMIDDAQHAEVLHGRMPDMLQGRDIIADFPIAEGPLIGQVLRHLRERALQGTVHTRDQALRAADEYLRTKLLLINGDDVLDTLATKTGGPFVRTLLDKAWQAQKEGAFANREDALAWLTRHIRDTD